MREKIFCVKREKGEDNENCRVPSVYCHPLTFSIGVYMESESRGTHARTLCCNNYL